MATTFAAASPHKPTPTAPPLTSSSMLTPLLTRKRSAKVQEQCKAIRGSRSRKSLISEFSHYPLQVSLPHRTPPASLQERGLDGTWQSLGVEPSELSLPLTLPTGQSFRWKQTGSLEFTGVVGSYLISLRQVEAGIQFLLHPSKGQKVDTQEAHRCLRDYLNLGTSLKDMWATFISVDTRFAALAPYLTGARLLRQHPLECLFQFVCSSNNHIQRISNMVDYLASLGSYLGTVNGTQFYAFPSLDQLANLTETQLRNAGFGYRAKYIVGAVEELRSKKGGGEQWLLSLRDQPLESAVESLCTLPGIGPKVAACIALFSLDQHHAIPVDTHVWQIATKYLTPELAGERLSPKLHNAVSEAFVKKFGKYAGWAHTVLFIAELSSHQTLLPEHLRTAKVKAKVRKLKTGES